MDSAYLTQKYPSVKNWGDSLVRIPSVVTRVPANVGNKSLIPGLGSFHMPRSNQACVHNYWTCTLEPRSATTEPTCLHASLHACMRAYKPTCEPTCLLVSLHAYMRAYMPTCKPTCLPVSLHVSLHAYLWAYMPTCEPTCHSYWSPSTLEPCATRETSTMGSLLTATLE